MNDIQKRFLLFLGGCIPVRITIAVIAMVVPLFLLRYLGFIALLPAFGFIYLFLTGGRKTGIETQGAPIWWGELRFIHGLFYLAFSVYAINKNRHAYLFLIADVVFGLLMFLWHHYTAGNFEKL